MAEIKIEYGNSENGYAAAILRRGPRGGLTVIDSIDLFEIDGRLFATSRDSDGARYLDCITLAETDTADCDETETGEDD